MTLEDREVADPDRPLEGTTWNVEGLISGDAVSSVPAGGRVPTWCWRTVTVVRRHRLQHRDAAATSSATAPSRSGRSPRTRMACTDPAAMEVEQIVLASSPGTATYEIEADVLTIRSGTNGLVLRGAGRLRRRRGDRGRHVDARLHRREHRECQHGHGGAGAGSTGDAHVRRRHGRRRHRLQHGLGRLHRSPGMQITFGPIAITLMACPEPGAGVEQSVLAVLDGVVTLTVADDVLTLMKGDEGLMYVAG